MSEDRASRGSVASTAVASNPHPNEKAKSTDLSLKKRPWRRHITPWHRIADSDYPGNGTESDPYVVDWLSEDPENPMTWKQGYKWLITLSVAISTLAVAMASSTLWVHILHATMDVRLIHQIWSNEINRRIVWSVRYPGVCHGHFRLRSGFRSRTPALGTIIRGLWTEKTVRLALPFFR